MTKYTVPGLSLKVSDLGEGIALVTIEHELLDPLVREAARGLSDYLRAPTAMRCNGCKNGPTRELLFVGPTDPPELALVTRCPHCAMHLDDIDRHIAVIATRRYLRSGALAMLRRWYAQFLQDGKARGADE